MTRVLLIASFFIIPNILHAEIIYLKSGASVFGEITGRSGRIVELTTNGIPLTYYLDEVERIEDDNGQQIYPEPEVQMETKVITFEVSEESASSSVKSPIRREVDPETVDKTALIREFMEAFGTTQLIKQNYHQSLLKMPLEQRAQVQDVFDVDEMVEILIPIYDKYFTVEELQAYLHFYRSAEGRKLQTTLPEVMKETIQASIEYIKEKTSQ